MVFQTAEWRTICLMTVAVIWRRSQERVHPQSLLTTWPSVHLPLSECPPLAAEHRIYSAGRLLSVHRCVFLCDYTPIICYAHTWFRFMMYYQKLYTNTPTCMCIYIYVYIYIFMCKIRIHLGCVNIMVSCKKTRHGVTSCSSLMRPGLWYWGGVRWQVVERPVFHLRDRENESTREWDRQCRRKGVRNYSERGQKGEGPQLTGASFGSGACFPKEVQEA